MCPVKDEVGFGMKTCRMLDWNSRAFGLRDKRTLSEVQMLLIFDGRVI